MSEIIKLETAKQIISLAFDMKEIDYQEIYISRLPLWNGMSISDILVSIHVTIERGTRGPFDLKSGIHLCTMNNFDLHARMSPHYDGSTEGLIIVKNQQKIVALMKEPGGEHER